MIHTQTTDGMILVTIGQDGQIKAHESVLFAALLADNVGYHDTWIVLLTTLDTMILGLVSKFSSSSLESV